MSALPSRFLNGDLLPSPSSFFSEWAPRTTLGPAVTAHLGLAGGGGHVEGVGLVMPSPVSFATPLAGSGPSFLRAELEGAFGKRKSPEMECDGEDGGGKRLKVEF